MAANPSTAITLGLTLATGPWAKAACYSPQAAFIPGIGNSRALTAIAQASA